MASEYALAPTVPVVFGAERDAMVDAISRAVVGIDTDDTALFDSAMTSDAVFELNGYKMEGIDAIHKGIYDSVAKLDTTHYITNHRVALHEGGTTAKMTASALAQHYRQGTGTQPDATRLLAGSLYSIDLAKAEDGLWKVKYWRLKVIWREGDNSIMGGQ